MSVTREFEPSGLVVLRTPLLPFEDLEAWSGGLLAAQAGDDALGPALAHDRALLRERLKALIERPEVREALWLASPDLAESVAHWRSDPESRKGQRTEHGLVRYFLRMAARPTPFGLFSGCTAGAFGTRTRLELAGRALYRRHSRLDMDYLFALCDHLAKSPEARAELRLFPNSSLYEAAGTLRYAEARLSGRLRTYHLVAVDAFDALRATLARARDGARLGDLAAALVADDPEQEITLAEAESFVHDLVENQLLLPELALRVTGAESGPALVEDLAGVDSAAAVRERLERAQAELGALDSGGLGADPERYRNIARDLDPLGVSVEISRLFQVDLVKPAREVTLGSVVLDEIWRAVDLLHRLAPSPDDGPLGEFRSAFKERYGEGREVPLLTALDEESGIGFDRSSQAAAEASPLLAGLAFRPRREQGRLPWTDAQATLLHRVGQALLRGEAQVELSDEDVERISASERAPLADGLHVMVTLAARSAEDLDRGDFRLLAWHAAGPSGARLLGRFCHADDAIRAGVLEHVAAEERLAPDALFAEIVHLPGGRVGNILARPLLRDYEIPFLGSSGAPRDKQIPVADLLITVIGERVRLRSRSLGRELIPRLTTAHNTARESLGVYRLLAALQPQGRALGLEWNWGALGALPFLPRVCAGRVVLVRARWRVVQAEVAEILAAPPDARYRLVRQWRRERRMPRLLALADGEHELLVDFDNPLGVDAVVDLFRGREDALLTEVFPDPDELCVQGPEGRFLHQLVVPFARRGSVAPQSARPRPAPARVALARTFPPGSEWLYAKLYCGSGTADRLLCEEIAPLAREALLAGAARSWFFIRYGDPEWHLRVRLRGDPEGLRSNVLPRLEQAFGRLVRDGSAWKFQLDTYEREVERYGGDSGIELAEELFFHDSEAVADMLQHLVGDAGADQRWRLMLAGMDRLMDDFGLDLEARLRLAERARDGFAARYQHEALRAPLAERVRRERAALERLLAANDAEGEPPPALAALARRSSPTAALAAELHARERAGRLSAPVVEMLTSFIHMFVNRLSRSAGPEHELVLYDFLTQLYRARRARAAGARGQRERVAGAPAR